MLPRIIVFLLAALANVLGLDPDLHDPSVWFASEAALAVVVLAAVSFIKRDSSIKGLASILLSLGTGAVLALAGYFGELFAVGTTLIQALMFGIGAAGGASMFFDALKAVFGPKSPEPVT